MNNKKIKTHTKTGFLTGYSFGKGRRENYGDAYGHTYGMLYLNKDGLYTVRGFRDGRYFRMDFKNLTEARSLFRKMKGFAQEAKRNSWERR